MFESESRHAIAEDLTEVAGLHMLSDYDNRTNR